MDDENAQNAPADVPTPPVISAPEPATPTPASTPESDQVTPTTPETPVEDASTELADIKTAPGPAQPEAPTENATATSESSSPAQAALTPPAPQPQSPAQPPQTPMQATPEQAKFSESEQFRDIQAHGRAKIQMNRSEKLDRLIQYAQKKQVIDNEEIQKLLHISSATATRYLVTLVQQGRLVRDGSPRHAKYRFVR
ncbi:MAG: hypothetical protein KGJ35_01305 [Patescibacteria group bacterium]|nr:hypothetical protein [Patescibacteria group bacterium]